MVCHLWAILLASLFLPSTLCLSSESYTLKEDITPPKGWIRHGRAPAGHVLRLKIALPQPHFAKLERHLYEVSDPNHGRYGQHLSKSEVEAMVGPHPDSLNAVNDWLSKLGIKENAIYRSPAKDWMQVNVPVVEAETFFNTKYYVWEHTESGEYLIRTTTYSVPSHLHEHIDLVQPTTAFSRFKAQRTHLYKSIPFIDNLEEGIAAIGPVDASCNRVITISCLQQIYNVSGFKPSGKDNSIGITGYLEQFANKADLRLFFEDQRPDATNASFKFVSIASGLNNQSRAEAGDEANLDVQFSMGLSYPIPATFFSTAGSPPFIPDKDTPTNSNEPYSTWLDFMLADPNPPLTITTSYGDDEQTVPKSLAERLCKGFAQLGARGVSLVFSSGDFGVGDGNTDPATQTCISNDGKNRTRFLPAFPASCPYVTSVGGTSHIPEVAVSTFYSGGGFSDVFKRPSYQDHAVESFLKKIPGGIYRGLFNRDGRGIPDVSAQADLFKVFVDGRAFLIGGTSAAAPTFAGFVAMLNDVRLRAGDRPLGFLNPFLYSKGLKGLNDITHGYNGGCGTTGFNATKGWDPVTGLGTPNFGKLRELVKQC